MNLFRRTITSLRFLYSVVAVFTVMGIGFSLLFNDWHCITRFGALIAITGVIMTFRGYIRRSMEEYYRSMTEFDGGFFETTPEEKEEKKQLKSDILAIKGGIFIIIIGTLLQAFGDLVNHLVAWFTIL